MKPRPGSLRGMLLLDGGNLRGSYFNRTVVLICQHDAEGAFGLVLNRPSRTTLDEAVPVDLPERLREEPVRDGGPVQPAALSYIHAPTAPDEGNVIVGVSLGHDLEALIGIVGTASPPVPLRVFAGYAGWAPGQLDDEIRRDSWLIHPADVGLVFHPAPGDLWKHVLRGRPDWRERLLADSPEDPSAN